MDKKKGKRAKEKENLVKARIFRVADVYHFYNDIY